MTTETGLSDAELYRWFAAGGTAPGVFGHREHVRTAYLFLSRHGDLAEGALAFRTALRRFAAAQGKSGIYHETLTWAYLVLIHERLRRGSFPSSHDFLAAYPELLDHRRGLLARYYDVVALTASPAARQVFLLPGDPSLAAPPAREERR